MTISRLESHSLPQSWALQYPSCSPQQPLLGGREKNACAVLPGTHDSKNKIHLAAGYKSQNITFWLEILSKTHLFKKRTTTQHLSQKERMPCWPGYVTLQSCYVKRGWAPGLCSFAVRKLHRFSFKWLMTFVSEVRSHECIFLVQWVLGLFICLNFL